MSGGRYPHIIRAILASPWAIDERSLAWAAILDVLELRAAGERLTDEEIEARMAAAANGPRAGGGQQGGVAILELYGVMVPRANLMSRMSGGTSAEQLAAQVQAAAADPDVSAIVIDVDSPGGNIAGITELAAAIRKAAERKPIAAVANHVMASAALHAVSGATELVATPSAQVGSIGVRMVIDDDTAAREQKGISRTVISAGRFKSEGFLAPTDEEIAYERGLVEEAYGVMVRDIAQGRHVPVATVRGESWGEGRVMFAKRALEVGMVDRIDSLDATIRRAARGEIGRQAAPTGAAAEAGYRVVVGEAVTDPAPDDQAGADPDDTGAAAGATTSTESPARVAPARRADLRLRMAVHAGDHPTPAAAGQ